MPTVATNAESWLRDLCRQFTQATGWPMQFTPASAADADVVERTLELDESCCWFSALSDGEQLIGYLHVSVPEGANVHPAFLPVRELAEVFGKLLNRLQVSQRQLATRTDDVSTLVNIGRSLPRETNLSQALNRLLQAAVRLTGFRAAAFFLLNPSTSELRLRAFYHRGIAEVPLPERQLTEQPPDLDALTKGRIVVSRIGSPTSARWLPDGISTAACVAVESDAGPIGTLWAYDRRNREPTERDCQVVESIASQLAGVLERVVLQQESQDGNRLQREMQVAAECRPTDVMAVIPTGVQFDAAAVCTSRVEVGGDLCELIPIDEARTIIAVGDASGHSVPAAMIMSAVRGSLHSLPLERSEDGFATDVLMERVNRALFAITPPHQFMSLLFGVLDTDEGSFTYTNAGHCTPIHIRDGVPAQLESHGVLLGIIEDAKYDRSTVPVRSGDVLVFYSDGITETVDDQNELFGAKGLISAVLDHRCGTAQQVLDGVLERLHAFADGKGEADDRTLLVIRLPEKNSHC